MDIHSPLPSTLPDGPEPDPTSVTSSIEPKPHYSIQVITKEEGLSNLESDWNRLSETAELPNVFMTHDWFRIWNQRITQEDGSGWRRPNVLVLRKEGVIAAISPLIYRIATRFGWAVRKVEFVGRQADYNDLVVGNDPQSQTEAIVDFLARTRDQWDLIDLRDLREAGNTLPLIEGALRRAGLIYRVLPEEERCPFLVIDSPWSTMVSRLSPSSRRTFRKQQSRLDRMSAKGLRVRIIENPLDEPGLLDKLISLEGQKHVRGELSQPFIAKYPEVFRSLFETLGPRGWFYVALMELGGRPLAWQLWFRCGKKLWGFLTAYDHAFSRLSPGTMLVPAMIDYGFSHGHNEYDFLRGEESYKMRWTTDYHQNCRLLIWSRRWTSRARAFMYLDLKATVYRLLGRAS